MKSLIFEYRYILAVALAAIFYVILDWQRAKNTLYKLMLNAKSLAKDAVLQSGEAQEEWVLEMAYKYLPLWIRTLISKEVMRKIIKFMYHKAKDYLDDGKVNSSI